MRAFATHHLLPAEGGDIELVPRQILRKGGGCRVAKRQPRTVTGDHVAMRHSYAGCCPVPSETDVMVVVQRRHIDDFAVRRFMHSGGDFQLFDCIRNPASAKAFPSDHFDMAFAEQ